MDSNLSRRVPEKTSWVYRRSRLESVFHLVALVLSLACLASAVLFFGEYFVPWGALVAAVFGVAALGYFLMLLRSGHRAWWKFGEDGPELEIKSWGKTKILEISAVDRVRSIPAWGRTLLWEGRKQRVLHHQLVGCEYLLERLRRERPELFPQPRDRLVFKVSRVGLFLHFIFFAGILAAAAWLASLGWIVVALAASLGVFPLFRLLRSTVREFVLDDEGVTVRYLLGSRRYAWAAASAWSEDSYASSGCSFYLMKFTFPTGNVILDEGQLLAGLRPHKDWILSRFFSSEKSVY